MLVVQILRNLGYDLLEAANGLEALYLYNNFYDDIDLIITDIEMPVMNGWELARRVKAAVVDLLELGPSPNH